MHGMEKDKHQIFFSMLHMKGMENCIQASCKSTKNHGRYKHATLHCHKQLWYFRPTEMKVKKLYYERTHKK